MIPYLALGDSYTIGEGVALFDSFPYQLCQFIRNEKISIQAPEIIAKTGWTTDELEDQILKYKFNQPYSFVTLLIGVNNQYRGRSLENFEPEFISLLKKAIKFTGNRKDRVFVLSIPDWGQTPFAKDRNREKISAEIDAYNNLIKRVCKEENIAFFDITSFPREKNNASFLVTSDELHPSVQEYSRWAGLIFNHIRHKIKNNELKDF
ncbi:MAG: SGNH/GDSL hydrolase family protein [Flavitalea sp.]